MPARSTSAGEVCACRFIIVMRAAACQPRLLSPEMKGKIVRLWESGSINAINGSASGSAGSFRVVSIQVSMFPPSLSAPPKMARLASIKYIQRPVAGTARSGGSTTRTALDVPIVSDHVSVLAQPEPTAAAAPSPMAGNHGTSRSAGHADAYSADKPRNPSCVSPSCGSCSGRTFSTFISSVSHARFRVLSKPVADAIARAHTDLPRNLRCRYSPKEIHCAVRLNTSGWLVASQRSLAGQKLACTGAPVR